MNYKHLHQTLSLLFITFIILPLSAQQISLPIAPFHLAKAEEEKLKEHFYKWELLQLDATAAWETLRKTETANLTLNFYNESWKLVIEHTHLLADSYRLNVHSEQGDQRLSGTSCLPLKAYAQNWQDDVDARLTLNKDYFSGLFRKGKAYYYIEPLSQFIPSAPPHSYVAYKASDVIPVENATCGAAQVRRKKKEIMQSILNKTGNCYEVELAIASDGLMFQKYGSVTAVENHNITVMNNVAGNWDDEFADEIQFIIVEQYVSTSPSADPWTSSTNPNALLNSFTAWGPTGFSQTHDLGQLWTDRDFDGSTIGIAWVGVVCTSNRYHCLQDFSSNAEFLRVLTSHEIGHNFDALHDASGSPYIMAPAVSTSTQWSSASVTDINAHIAAKAAPNGCLAACPPPLPPVAAFTPNVNPSCPGGMITFFDQSLNSPSSWSWNFPGGTPSSSTEQNPTITYNNPGVYTASLTVTNANGSNTTSMQISVVPAGGTEFFYFEDFENGLGGWTVQNPDNNITWTLQSVNGTRQGGQAVFVENFNYNTNGQRDALISPILDFAGRTSVELEIEYAYARYNASNSDSLVVYVSTDGGNTYQWVWGAAENGSGNFATVPDQTTAFSPAVQEDWCYATTYGPGCINIDLSAYDNTGNIRIKIENVNDFGNNMYVDNIRLFSSCFQLNPPIADFSANPTSGCTPLQVQFTDLSQENPSSWQWSFPGGIPSVSTQQNPSVVYLTPGDYDVTLVVANAAGSDVITKTNYIHVDGPPQADFSYNISGATVSFTDLSAGNPTSWLWSFGDSQTSTQQNPTHTYDQDGTYTVALTVTNNCGTSTQFYDITIITPPTAGFTADTTEGCVPLTVQFTSTASPNTTSWQWTFPGGTPSASSQQNPTVTYNNPGTFDVSLTVSNAAGSDQITQNNYITVNEQPHAVFAVLISQDTLFVFNNSSGAESYLWDFGDGTTDTTANPAPHVYAQDGNYTVSLTATNDCGSDTYSVPITIFTVPIAGFSADVSQGCAPLSVQFTDLSSDNATSWNWTFQGGQPATSNEQNPSVTYNNPGTFDVTLIVSNSAGTDTLTQTAFIEVGIAPDATIDFQINGQEVEFSADTSHATYLMWQFGDGNTSTEAHPTHTYAEDGSYLVELTVGNECGEIIVQQQIVIATQGPIALFDSDLQEGCVPFEVQFINMSSENASGFAWHFPGGDPEFSMAESPLVSYTQAGQYDVTLIAFNDNGSDTITLSNYIHAFDVPQVNFSFSGSGSTILFQSELENADTYIWDFGDGQTSSEANPVHTYANTGTYIVVLSASNDCGESSVQQEINVQIELPLANFTADTTTGCAPLQVQFTDLSTGDPTAWSWSFEGGTPSSSTEQNPIITYETAGTYSVTLTAINGGGSNMLVQTDYIQVMDLPEATFTYQQNGLTIHFTANTSNADSYLWDFGDGDMSTLANPSHTYTAGGSYMVKLTVENACGEVSEQQEIVITTGISDPGFAAQWLVYPNPSAGLFEIMHTGSTGPFTLQILDLPGKEIYRVQQLQGSTNGWKKSIDLRNLPAGVYLLKITSSEVQATWKIILER